MTVFKGYLQIIKRNMGMIVMYMGIFLSVCMMIQRTLGSAGVSQGFSSVKINVGVVNRDGGILAKTLTDYMDREQNLVEIEDQEEIIQEELFYRNVSYVLVIPEGIEEACRAGNAAVQAIKVPESYDGYYLDACVNNLLNQVRTYLSGGFSMEEACQAALKLGEKKGTVTLVDLNGNEGVRTDYNYYFAYLPYGLLGSMIMSMSVVIMEFKKRSVSQRMRCSAVPFLRQQIAAVGAFLLVGAFTWGIYMLAQAGLYGGGMFKDTNALYYILNSLSCMLVAMALAYVSGILAHTPASLNGLNNVLSLGLCFLGGVFVPIEMLGEGIEKVSRFTPTYWYSKINGILGNYGELGSELKGEIFQGLLIQVLFAAACIAVTMAVKKALERKNPQR